MLYIILKVTLHTCHGSYILVSGLLWLVGPYHALRDMCIIRTAAPTAAWWKPGTSGGGGDSKGSANSHTAVDICCPAKLWCWPVGWLGLREYLTSGFGGGADWRSLAAPWLQAVRRGC